MLAKPEWNDRFEVPRQPRETAGFFEVKADRYLMLVTFAAGIALVLAGVSSML
jgi:hypothetical protein